MANLIKRASVVGVLIVSCLAFVACTGGGGLEDKYAKVFSDINPDWQLYEVKKEGENTVLLVEVSDVVSFKDAKKAVDAIQKIDPQLAGYIDFYNAEVGMTLRRMEIIPAST